MVYRIIVTPNAEAEIRAAYRFIGKESRDAASRWAKGVRARIASLRQYPERSPMAPESAILGEPVREIFYGSGNRGTYRVLFMIVGENIFVLSVRHGSRLPAGSS